MKPADPDSLPLLINQADIGRLCGFTRQRSHQVVNGKFRGPPFPAPKVRHPNGNLWARDEVIEWFLLWKRTKRVGRPTGYSPKQKAS